jgi:hypothetical protein
VINVDLTNKNGTNHGISTVIILIWKIMDIYIYTYIYSKSIGAIEAMAH